MISVGNLRAGGSGKTPIVEALARLLMREGERPVILTRGYGRRIVSAGSAVVADGQSVLADVEHAGDEPLMLARHLPGVPVIVDADRYRAGMLAERQFGATVHVLDDGFQHVALGRDIDLLAVDPEDLTEPVIPAGYLREPLSAAALADALLVPAAPDEARRVGRGLGVTTVFSVKRVLGAPRLVTTGGDAVLRKDEPVLAVAAIARPQRFFDDLTAGGWKLAGTMDFRDHHWFTSDDLEQVARRAHALGARAILTTEKDAVRFEVCDLARVSVAIAAVPLTATIEPSGPFREWLVAALYAARHPGP